MKKSIYLDYNATTPVDRRVLETMLPYFSENYGNAASRTHAYGWIAEEAVKKAREELAQLINCLAQEIIFTSGATESISLAINGVWENYQTKGKHIITVKTEHKAILDTCNSLKLKGAEVTYLSVDREGVIDLEELKKELRPNTILVAIMYANNETGVIQPIQQIAELVHANNSLFMCDASQAIGKIFCNVEDDNIDLMCISAHKYYGPKGVGALYIRRKNPRVTRAPQIYGGGHERGLRSGTLNVPGIVGLGKASEIARLEMWEDSVRISKLRTKLEQELCSLKNVYINVSIKNRLFNVTNILIQGIRSETILKKNPYMALSIGSACTSANQAPSHVLTAMGLNDSDCYSSIRFSLGKYTTADEINEVIKTFVDIINLDSINKNRHLD